MYLLILCFNPAANALTKNPWKTGSMTPLKHDRLIDVKGITPRRKRIANDQDGHNIETSALK